MIFTASARHVATSQFIAYTWISWYFQPFHANYQIPLESHSKISCEHVTTNQLIAYSWISWYFQPFPANYQIPLESHSMIFTASAPLGRFNHRVTMSVCVSVPVRHRAHFFKRFFNNLEITRSVPGLVNPKPRKKEKFTDLNFHQIGPLGRVGLVVE